MRMDNAHHKDLKLECKSTKLKKFNLKPGIYHSKDGNILPRLQPFFNVSDLPFPNLEELSLNSVSIDCKVFNGLRTIRCLNLSDCYFKEEVKFVSVATVLPYLQCLESLHMGDGSLRVFCRFPNEFQRFFEVLREIKTLRCLQLQLTTHRSSICSYNHVSQLLVPDVDNFENMTVGLGNTLLSLSLGDFYAVEDAIVRLIASNLRKLKLVDLSGCYKITDSGFASFSGHPCLEVVDIVGCSEITYNSIAMTIETLPRIQKLFIMDYPGRTELDLALFNQVCLRMDYLKVVIRPQGHIYGMQKRLYKCCAYNEIRLKSYTPFTQPFTQRRPALACDYWPVKNSTKI